MRTLKLAIAFAMFMTSVSFENQIISQNGSLSSNWNVTIQANNEAFARAMAMEASMDAF